MNLGLLLTFQDCKLLLSGNSCVAGIQADSREAPKSHLRSADPYLKEV